MESPSANDETPPSLPGRNVTPNSNGVSLVLSGVMAKLPNPCMPIVPDANVLRNSAPAIRHGAGRDQLLFPQLAVEGQRLPDHGILKGSLRAVFRQDIAAAGPDHRGIDSALHPGQAPEK